MPLSLFGFPSCSAAHRTSTRAQEHAKYVPTRFLHVVMFSKSCAANKAAWSHVRPLPLLVFDSYEFLKAGTNKCVNKQTNKLQHIIHIRRRAIGWLIGGRSVGVPTTLVQTEISQHLLDGLAPNLVKTFMGPRWWIQAPPWGWHLWFSGKCLSNYWMDYHDMWCRYSCRPGDEL